MEQVGLLPSTERSPDPKMPLVIADQSWLVRDGLARLISEIDPARVVHTAADGPVLHRKLRATPDLATVLIGAGLLNDQGTATIDRIRVLAPDAGIGILSGDRQDDRVVHALHHGAHVEIFLHDSKEDVTTALEKVMSGGARMRPQPNTSTSPRQAAVPPDLRLLTRRERDVFALLGRGLTVLLLADQLKMSPHTARVHVTPLGVYVIRGSDVTWQPALDLQRIITGGQAVGALAILTVLVGLLRRRR